MPGLAKLLRGCLQYNATLKPRLIEQFKTIRDHPEPQGVMFSCMDSRMLITRFLQCDVGDMFLVRNAGNLVPHRDSLSANAVTTEPGALELGCVINDIRQVLVCGHSDCKAMNALYGMRDSAHVDEGSPLQLWLKKHGSRTVEKYKQLLKTPGGVGPIQFQAETTNKYFDAYIDEENHFAPEDKLSQVNTLQQIQNISSHSILKDKLEMNKLHVNALWFDVYTGDFHMFSRTMERFLPINKDNYDHLIQDGESTDDKILVLHSHEEGEGCGGH